ncbi:MAG TPA: MmgE/PrpD family protein [Candidatus Binatia bacterium]
MAGAGENLKTLAQTMAEFTFGLRYDSIPANVVAAARRHLADTLACALGAHNAPMILALCKDAIAKGGRADATIIATAEKVPAALAAMVNGVMVRYLDGNDIFVLSRGGASGHFSDGTAGLLALAEQYRRSGEELLTCLVASYELQGALAESLNFWERGLHPVTNVAWVVPIVAARLMGDTAVEAVHACGLSVATGTVMNTWIRPADGVTMIKHVAVGLALKRALEAAELASLGVTATADALETVCARLSQPGAPFDPALIEHLGRNWSMTRNMLKLYPAQINTQAAIEATVRLHQRGIRAEQVRKLTLRGHRNVAGGVQGSAPAFAPASRESADHSTPYVMAMALLRGRLTPREYEGAPWESAEVKAIMANIELAIDSEMDEAFATRGILGVRLIAELNDGRTEEIVVRQPKGHPDAPLSDAELLEKMTWLVKTAAPALAPPRLLDLCNRLSTAEDLETLIESCRVKQP